MLRQTSPDKIRGKFVKYRLGDCLAIKKGHHYIGAIMTGKFNKYYNLTLMEFNLKTKPTIDNFTNGRFFGTRFGSWEALVYGVDQQMMECKYIDNEPKFEKIGAISLISDFVTARYFYLKTIDEIFKYYQEEIEVRVKKSIDAEKFPTLAFAGRHLLATEKVVLK